MNTDDKSGRRRGGNQSKMSAYDFALVKAKTEKKPVDAVLALETNYTTHDGEFMAQVCHVDTYAIQFELSDGRKPWVSKAFIVSVILHD